VAQLMPVVQSMSVELLYHESNVDSYFPVSPVESVKPFGLAQQDVIVGLLAISAQAFYPRGSCYEIFQIKWFKIGNFFKFL